MARCDYPHCEASVFYGISHCVRRNVEGLRHAKTIIRLSAHDNSANDAVDKAFDARTMALSCAQRLFNGAQLAVVVLASPEQAKFVFDQAHYFYMARRARGDNPLCLANFIALQVAPFPSPPRCQEVNCSGAYRGVDKSLCFRGNFLFTGSRLHFRVLY